MEDLMGRMETSSEYVQGKGYQPCKDVAGSKAIFPSPLELIARVTLGPEYNQGKEKEKGSSCNRLTLLDFLKVSCN